MTAGVENYLDVLIRQWGTILNSEGNTTLVVPTIPEAVIGAMGGRIFIAINNPKGASNEDVKKPGWLRVASGSQDQLCGKTVLSASRGRLNDMIMLMAEIHNTLQEAGIDTWEATTHSLRVLFERWSPDREPMGRKKQLGLIGELSFLGHLIDEFGPEAIAWWVGSDARALHDFKTPSYQIEIKSTTSLPPMIWVSEPEQLWPGKGTIGLVVYIAKESKDGFKLPEFIDQLLDNCAGSSSLLMQKLAAAGYSEDLSDKFRTRWRMDGEESFEVTPDRVLIGRETLEAIPREVKKIRYLADPRYFNRITIADLASRCL